MSMKENMDFVKKELNSEEKFFESFVRIERFYKKYKKVILVIAVAFLLFGIYYFVNKNLQEVANKNANIAFAKFLKNPNDTHSLLELKENNKDLYGIALYLQAKKDNKLIDNIQVKYFKQLAQYSNALKNKNIEKLTDVITDRDFLLRDFALFDKALLLTENKKYKEAGEVLKDISKTSQVQDLASLLKHYLAVK